MSQHCVYLAFDVKGREESPYLVEFWRYNQLFEATCTCEAGSRMKLCKHRLALLAGDASSVVSDNAGEAQHVAELANGTRVARTLKDYFEATSQPDRPFHEVRKLRDRLNVQIHGMDTAAGGIKPIHPSIKNMMSTPAQRERDRPMKTREAKKRLYEAIALVCRDHGATLSEAAEVVLDLSPKRQRVAISPNVLEAFTNEVTRCTGSKSTVIVTDCSKRGDFSDLADVKSIVCSAIEESGQQGALLFQEIEAYLKAVK